MINQDKSAKSAKSAKFAKLALDKMFQCVGFKQYDEQFTKQDKWYLLRKWTKEEENAYRAWFIKQFMKAYKVPQKVAAFEAAWFLLDIGWTTKQDETHSS